MIIRIPLVTAICPALAWSQASPAASRPDSRATKPAAAKAAADSRKAAPPGVAPAKPAPVKVDPKALKPGSTYKVSRETELVTLTDFLWMQKGLTTTDKLERKTDKVGAGSTFTVQTISVVGGVTWYTMFAAVAGKASNASDGMYFGAIKVAWLTGQTIELVE